MIDPRLDAVLTQALGRLRVAVSGVLDQTIVQLGAQASASTSNMQRQILMTADRELRLKSGRLIQGFDRELKVLGEMIGLGMPLTTYVARHTYATVLKRSGVSVALISESLGHSDLSTTQLYLDSFENSQIDAAMQHLL